MAGRVLSTEQAKMSIQRIQSIVNGGLSDQITQLDQQGRLLSDPNVWDGPLAERFRSQDWPQVKSALDRMQQELNELREHLAQISTNIMQAGGAS